MELGYSDTMRQRIEVEAFLEPQVSSISLPAQARIQS